MSQEHSLFSPADHTTHNPPQVFIKEEYASSTSQHYQNTEYKVVGQIWDSYIIVQHQQGLWYIDQHALAERIAFEKLKRTIQSGEYQMTTLLSPISISLPSHHDSQSIADHLNTLKFETTIWGEHSLIIYKVPQFLVDYTIDIEKIMRHLMSENGELSDTDGANLGITNILDSIFATRACKTSIKANHRLSLLEMQQLVNDGFIHIP